MAYSVISDHYSEDEIQLAKFAKALSHPARLSIIKFLYNNKYCYVSEMVKQLPISQSSVSQHLKELKDAILLGAANGPIKSGIKLYYTYFIGLFLGSLCVIFGSILIVLGISGPTSFTVDFLNLKNKI